MRVFEKEGAVGWWAISEGEFLAALRRVEAGERADLVLAELRANADVEDVTAEAEAEAETETEED